MVVVSRQKKTGQYHVLFHPNLPAKDKSSNKTWFEKWHA